MLSPKNREIAKHAHDTADLTKDNRPKTGPSELPSRQENKKNRASSSERAALGI